MGQCLGLFLFMLPRCGADYDGSNIFPIQRVRQPNHSHLGNEIQLT